MEWLVIVILALSVGNVQPHGASRGFSASTRTGTYRGFKLLRMDTAGLRDQKFLYDFLLPSECVLFANLMHCKNLNFKILYSVGKPLAKFFEGFDAEQTQCDCLTALVIYSCFRPLLEMMFRNLNYLLHLSLKERTFGPNPTSMAR